ncbi:MAG TPA: hypothetical protein VLZ76_02715 [Lysobacter sp.]|nr:hypothetical protein [Lysobacter sp.]
MAVVPGFSRVEYEAAETSTHPASPPAFEPDTFTDQDGAGIHKPTKQKARMSGPSGVTGNAGQAN